MAQKEKYVLNNCDDLSLDPQHPGTSSTKEVKTEASLEVADLQVQ